MTGFKYPPLTEQRRQQTRELEMAAMLAGQRAGRQAIEQALAAPPSAAPMDESAAMGQGAPFATPGMGQGMGAPQSTPDGLPPIPPPTPPMSQPSGAGVGMGAAPVAGGPPPVGPGAGAAMSAPGPLPQFAEGGVVGGAAGDVDVAGILDFIAQQAEQQGGMAAPDMASDFSGTQAEPMPAEEPDPEIDALITRAQSTATSAPKRFTDYLDGVNAAEAEGLLADLAAAYHFQPGQAGVLWELVRLAVDQGDEDVPPELLRIVRGGGNGTRPSQQAASSGRTPSPSAPLPKNLKLAMPPKAA